MTAKREGIHCLSPQADNSVRPMPPSYAMDAHAASSNPASMPRPCSLWSSSYVDRTETRASVWRAAVLTWQPGQQWTD